MAPPSSTATAARRRPWLLPVVGALMGGLLFFLVGPHPPTLGQGIGDRVLISDAREALGDPGGYGTVSVARIRDGQATWAGFAPDDQQVDENSRFELGSITKTFNGLLLADAQGRGEVLFTDPLERHLPELTGT